MKHTHFLTIVLLTTAVFTGCSLAQTPPPQPSPVTTPQVTTQDIRSLIDSGVGARESGDYQTGEAKLSQAFADAITIKDKALTIEAGNNLSIQYRLSAGRDQRQKKHKEALQFSTMSLDVYQQLRSLSWFDQKDPNIERNWAHALLYAGKVDQAFPELQASFALQTSPAAQGDELDHMAAAMMLKGRYNEAYPVLTKGINLIQDNDGSPVWLTFGLMTKATWQSHNGHDATASATLKQAMSIAQEKNLSVRQEEIKYLLAQPASNINVMNAVMTPQ